MPVQTNQTTETDKAKAKAAVDRIVRFHAPHNER